MSEVRRHWHLGFPQAAWGRESRIGQWSSVILVHPGREGRRGHCLCVFLLQCVEVQYCSQDSHLEIKCIGRQQAWLRRGLLTGHSQAGCRPYPEARRLRAGVAGLLVYPEPGLWEGVPTVELG